jgi:2-iminobutanoate/2-iminopropanoate deaminase
MPPRITQRPLQTFAPEEQMARKTHAHSMILSRRVPKPRGPGVHAVRVDAPGPALYVAQLLPLEPPLGKMCPGPIRKQADVVFAALRQVVVEAGFTLDQVVRITLYVTTLKHMDIIDELYTKLFFTLAQPARTVLVVAGLAEDALIAVDAVAIKPQEPQPALPAPGANDMADEEMY